jgi:hypothetical protein
MPFRFNPFTNKLDLVDSGGSGSSVTYVTDDASSATPSLGILNLLTNQTTENNDHGIQSRGSGNTVTTYLTNRMTGSVTTTDATPTLIKSFDLGATPGAFSFNGTVIGYNTTTPGMHTTDFSFAAVTDGATANTIGASFFNSFESASMVNSNVAIGDDLNTVEVFAIGVAGQTINWNVVMEYRTVV